MGFSRFNFLRIKRKGYFMDKNKVGRPPGPTGKELKKRVTIAIYPSDIKRMDEIGIKAQKLMDIAVADLLNDPGKYQRYL